MSEQLAIAFARKTDPQTSHDAAARVDAPTLMDRVYTELKVGGPATSHELAARMGLSLVTVSPRMKPLQRLNMVRAKGKCDGRTIWEAV